MNVTFEDFAVAACRQEDRRCADTLLVGHKTSPAGAFSKISEPGKDVNYTMLAGTGRQLALRWREVLQPVASNLITPLENESLKSRVAHFEELRSIYTQFFMELPDNPCVVWGHCNAIRNDALQAIYFNRPKKNVEARSSTSYFHNEWERAVFWYRPTRRKLVFRLPALDWHRPKYWREEDTVFEKSAAYLHFFGEDPFRPDVVFCEAIGVCHRELPPEIYGAGANLSDLAYTVATGDSGEIILTKASDSPKNDSNIVAIGGVLDLGLLKFQRYDIDERGAAFCEELIFYLNRQTGQIAKMSIGSNRTMFHANNILEWHDLERWTLNAGRNSA